MTTPPALPPAVFVTLCNTVAEDSGTLMKFAALLLDGAYGAIWCGVVHNGAMATARATTHRQTITLDAPVARKARALARQRGVSTSRLLARLVEEGLESEQAKRSRFMELAEQFRAATDPGAAEKLGHQLGRMVFGN